MFLVAGLGNPGQGYALNRHNAGFMAADELVRRHKFLEYRNKFSAQLTQGTIADHKILLIKPQTYMNLSGQAVTQTAQFYKINSEQIIVIHDDLDLTLGTIKVKRGGGNGGHNGLKSIDDSLGSKNYLRVRIGIGRPLHRNLVTDYVLNNFLGDEQTIIQQKLLLIAENFAFLLNQELESFVNKITVKPALKTSEESSAIKKIFKKLFS